MSSEYGEAYYGSYGGLALSQAAPTVPVAHDKVVQFRVYTGDGEVIRTWPDVTDFPTFRWPINGGPGAMKITLPRAWGDAGEPGEPGSLGDLYFGNLVKAYVFDRESGPDGVLVYQGEIEDYTQNLAGETVDLTLAPYTVALSDREIVEEVTLNTDPTFMITIGWLGGLFGSKITPQITNPAVGVRYRATFGPNEKVKSALDRIQRLAGGRWYWRLNPDGGLVFNEYSKTTADHILHIGREVAADTKIRKSRVDLRYRVIVTGAAGIQGIAARPGYSPEILPRDLHYANPKITDQSTALRIANSLLDFYSGPTFETECLVLDNTLDPENGYDIESLRPGNTVALINPSDVFAFNRWGDDHTWGDGSTWGGLWREQSQKPLVIADLEYGFHWARLRLHNRPNTVPEQLAQLSDRLLLTGG